MRFGVKHTPQLLRWASDALHRGSVRVDRLASTTTDHTPAVAEMMQPRAFERATQSALVSAELHNSRIHVLAVSVDYFDVVTASHGYTVGQEVLAVAAQRIRDAVRPGDAITQLSSDGFALLCVPPDGAPDIDDVAGRIAAKFDQPVITSAGQLPATVSIGVASAAGQSAGKLDAPTMHRQAQTAVMSAQRNGRAQRAFFDRSVQVQAIESYETERHLRAALHNNDLSVHYQPVINLNSGTVASVEALARWKHETLGFVSPLTFIPIAEASGLIGQLGRYVLEAAIEQGSLWNNVLDPKVMLAVNLSNRQLLDPDLLPTLGRLFEEHILHPSQLCLEISETVVMSDVAASMTILGHLKDLGVSLAIDDFGTGYSSLSYLRRLPVDILKIDRSFVQSIYNRDDRVITKAIIDLAHTLGMTTIAEGVETQLQVEVLHALNCDMAQGFLLHPPTTSDQVNFSPIDFENSARSNSYHEVSPTPAALTRARTTASAVNENRGSMSELAAQAAPFARQ